MKHYWQSLRNIGHVRRHTRYDGDVIHTPLAGAERALPKRFNMLVWNVFKGHFGSAFDVQILEFAKQCEVLCLQEVLYDDAPQLPDALGHWAYDYSPSYSRRSRAHEGVITLSCCTLLPTGSRRRSVGTEPLVATPKSSVLSQLPLEGGGVLSIVNMHMLLFRGKKAAVAELEAAIDLLESQAPTDGPALFVGDLNTVFPRQLRAVDTLLATHQFQRIQPDVDPRRFRRLDHVYARNLRHVDLQVIGHRGASDHPALMCAVVLR